MQNLSFNGATVKSYDHFTFRVMLKYQLPEKQNIRKRKHWMVMWLTIYLINWRVWCFAVYLLELLFGRSIDPLIDSCIPFFINRLIGWIVYRLNDHSTHLTMVTVLSATEQLRKQRTVWYFCSQRHRRRPHRCLPWGWVVQPVALPKGSVFEPGAR